MPSQTWEGGLEKTVFVPRAERGDGGEGKLEISILAQGERGKLEKWEDESTRK